MPWVWLVLVVALLVTVGLCTVALVRKAIRVLAALGDLLSAPAVLDGVHRAEEEPREFAVLEPAAVARARVARYTVARVERKTDRRRRRSARAHGLLHADPGPIAARLAGLDSNRRSVGGAYTKDDHHVE